MGSIGKCKEISDYQKRSIYILKVIEANVIGWLQKESINKNNKRWTIWKRASSFPFLYSAMPQKTLYSCLQRYKFFTRRYTDFKKFIENFTVWNWRKTERKIKLFYTKTRVLQTCFVILHLLVDSALWLNKNKSQ